MNWRKTAAVLVALAGATVAAVAAPSAAIAADNGPWEINPASYGAACLEVAGGTTSLSGQVQIWTCATLTTTGVTPLHQRWIFRSTSNGYYRLVNGKSGMCMNIKGSTDVNSTKIIQYTCGSSTTLNDQWYPRKMKTVAGFDYYRFESRLNPAKCLNVQGNLTANGTDLILYTCSSANNNVFTWFPAKQA